MASGLIALLDDVAAIAKLAAASLDDVAGAAGKAGSKSIGVVVDDTAVTPGYAMGFSPERELPIVAKILEEHGGGMELLDNPSGRGGQVLMWIPKTHTAAAAEPVDEPRRASL